MRIERRKRLLSSGDLELLRRRREVKSPQPAIAKKHVDRNTNLLQFTEPFQSKVRKRSREEGTTESQMRNTALELEKVEEEVVVV